MKFISAALITFSSSVLCEAAPAFTTQPVDNSMHPAVGWTSATGRGAIPYMPIVYPKSGEIWLGATHHNVTWDTKNVPSNQTFHNTAVFLAQKGKMISDEPLASNFSLTDGRVTVQTPKEVNGDDFQLILFAEHGSHEDRGSYSDAYSIVNVDVWTLGYLTHSVLI